MVDKIKNLNDEYHKKTYNIEAVAQKSVINSEKYDEYGLILKWNYHLWMKQFVENITTVNGSRAIGDIKYVSGHEMYMYTPFVRELTAGWRETGHMQRSKFFD